MSQRYSPHPDPRNARGRARQPDRLPDTDPYMPRPGRSVARPHETAPPQKVKARSEFTFHHAGKRVRIGPVAFWTLVGTLVIMAGWSIVTATYFAFHDDVLARLIAHEAAMQFAYEDRIAEMRMQVDRMASRQLLNQEQFEQKLEQLLHRQSLLESRAATLGTLADPTTTGSIKAAPRSYNPSEPTVPAKPSPINAVMPGSDIRRDLRASAAPTSTVKVGSGGLDAMLTRLQDDLNRIDARQANSLSALEESYDAKARRMITVLADLGLEPGRSGGQAVGGPYVPLKAPPESNTFERQIYRVNVARAQVDRLNRTLAVVPVRRPVAGEVDQTSSFGVRIDPFVGRPAMHTGTDFRGNVGDPIRATAAGTVTHAGWSGGYGNMVEVDHGNGLSTRYGHLSEIEATVGETVRAGQVIGRLGSTGRSTGPHLHYETRVDGEAVDPERFLRAGARLGVL
jgi:murein DD-endopeptidase MepM/ murein hydrolase activator NlpD